MKEKISNEVVNINQQNSISSRYLLNLIKPILAEELVATFRFSREGLRIAFLNGQKFLLKIEEI